MVAWMLRYGELDGSAFVGQVDDAVVSIAHRVSYEVWDDSGFPTRFPAAVQLDIADGRRLEYEIPDVLGGATRPLTEDAIAEKARSNFLSAGFTETHTAALIAELLDPQTRLDRVTSLLRSPLQRLTSGGIA